MNGYKAFYKGKEIELYAESLFAAKAAAVAAFKAKPKEAWRVHVVLCEVAGESVLHSPSEL